MEKRSEKKTHMVVEWLVLRPLRTLFLLGPSWIGGYGGAEPSDICAQLTTSPARFWDNHPDECERIVSQKINSNLVVVTTAFYFWILFTMTSLCFRAFIMRWTLGRPLGLLANAVSIGNHSAGNLRLPTSPHLRSATEPSPPRLPDCDTRGTALKHNVHPQ